MIRRLRTVFQHGGDEGADVLRSAQAHCVSFGCTSEQSAKIGVFSAPVMTLPFRSVELGGTIL